MALLRILFSISIALCSLNGFSQMLSPLTGRDFSVYQKFNPTFIKNQGIAEIRCEKEIKRDGDRIRKTQQVDVYHFHPDGRLKMVSKINFKLRDTAITYFEYVGSRLDCEVKNDAAGMYSYCYEYGKDGLPLSRKYGRASRFQSLTVSVDPAPLPEVTSEVYSHSRYEDQLHSTLYNSANRPYQKEIRYYDEHEYLIKYLKTFVMSSAILKENYAYNAGGWLSEHISNDGSKEIKKVFSYDEIGNILVEDAYVNGQIDHHLEYVYNEDDMRIRAELQREDKHTQIVITNYTYINR